MTPNSDGHVAVPVSNGSFLTPYVFYDYLLPTLRQHLLDNPKKMICLDMTSVERISPLVIPNLPIVGRIIKAHFGMPIEIVLSSLNLNVNSFLYYIGFFRKIDKYKYYTYDTAFVGGFTSERTGDLGNLECFTQSVYSPEPFRTQVLPAYRDIKAFINHFDDYGMAELLLSTISELCHNAILHGYSAGHGIKNPNPLSVVCLYGGPSMGLQCAISDCGIGYQASLIQKPQEMEVFSPAEFQREPELANLRAIIEAVFRRFHDDTYGIWTVIKDIAEIGGTVRIHTSNTQVVFTPRNFSLLTGGKSKVESARELEAFLVDRTRSSATLQSSPCRIRESQLAGVHIEFEIPPKSNHHKRKT